MFIQSFHSYPVLQKNYLRTNSTKPIEKRVSFRGDESDYFDYTKRYQEKLDSRPRLKKLFGMGKKQIKKELNSELIGFNLVQHRLIEEKNKRIKEIEKQVQQKAEVCQALQEKTTLLQQQIKLAQESKEKDEIILGYKKELEELKAKREHAAKDLVSETEKLNKLAKEQLVLVQKDKNKGWGKVAGYIDYKTAIEEAFINKLQQEKDGFEVSMPNGILFYGQHGTGKTHFAKAFAEEAGCDFIEIDMMQDDDDVLMDLGNALKQSKKTYKSAETPKKRTIILLDDFNSVAELSNSEKSDVEKGESEFSETNVGRLAKYLENCASKYYATIFMTTNHPRKIDSELLDSERIPCQIFLGPPQPLDAAEIFKYHLDGVTTQEIDYLKLGNEIAKAIEKEEAFSAQGIVDVINEAKKNCKNSEITQEDLLKAIEKKGPDIKKEYFNKFLDDMNEYCDTLMHKNGENN